MELINSFKKYLVAIIPNIVYKSVRQAEEYETPESRVNGDLYIESVLKTDSLITYASSSIPESILNKVGIYDKSQIKEIQENKFLIPIKLRDKVIELMREYTISNYEEKKVSSSQKTLLNVIQLLQRGKNKYLPSDFVL